MWQSTTGWLHLAREITRLVGLSRRREAIRPSRLEIVWTAADREATWGGALAAAPREGATLALCRRSTGRSRETFIVQQPLPPEPGDLSYARGWVVSVTSQYLNRVLDRLGGLPPDVGIAVLHTHPGHACPSGVGMTGGQIMNSRASCLAKDFSKVARRSCRWSERMMHCGARCLNSKPGGVRLGRSQGCALLVSSASLSIELRTIMRRPPRPSQPGPSGRFVYLAGTDIGFSQICTWLLLGWGASGRSSLSIWLDLASVR
ncbi:hypothetical protein BH24GEM1_BH24GEM1_01880 [soil metagenome]